MAAIGSEQSVSPRAASGTRHALLEVFDELLSRANAALANAGVWHAACALVIALQAVLIFSHRPWLDEWQALRIALQSPTLRDLMDNLRYEGHPPLWYLLLRGAAWVVPTPYVLPAVAALLAAPTQWAILTRAPFPRVLRLALALNAFMLFDDLTVSRSLTLGVACAVVAITRNKSRWRWVPIALLPFCDFLFGVISVVLVVLTVRDRRWWWPGLCAWVLSGVIALWSVIPAPDMVQALQLEGLALDLTTHLQRLGVLLIPFQTQHSGLQWNGFLPLGLGTVAGPLFVLFAWRQTRHDLVKAMLVVGMLLLTAVFSVTVYPLHNRHLGLVALLLILLKWQDAREGRPADRWFASWLIAGAACGLMMAAINLVRPFDTAHLAASYITRNDMRTKHWLVWPESRAEGVSALLGIEFERLEQDCTVGFVRWNHRESFENWRDIEVELRRIVRLRGQSYLLTDVPVDLPADFAQPIAMFPAGYDGFRYYITRLGPNEPEKHIRVPSCVPGMRSLTRPTLWQRL